ncbi:hypothetical protein [Sphingobacterium sp. JUb56]|jgi:hypothetical protein|uniref:hypothetical protein n=1 Tax=Sphingobacterium sp. JUb56 TaxID=2587145 RepID=UPI00160B8830|nr:hypothetical protein [Sphingobacterium sp. JUb56]MBB2950181.1 hypothetical protein [Sphingobacterium sp. JUb56]
MALFEIIDPAHPAEQTSYTPAGSPPPNCLGNNQICTINATNSGGQPVINQALLSEMVTALNTRTSSANVKLKA